MTGHVVATPGRQLLSTTRYRHPGDVIRLLAGATVVVCCLVGAAVAPGWLLEPTAPVVTEVVPDPAGNAVTGVVQLVVVAAGMLVVIATLRHRRFRLLAGLAIAAAPAPSAMVGILHVVGGEHPEALTAHLAVGSWAANTAFPGLPVVASTAAVITAASPWLSRTWSRAAWVVLLLASAARLLTGTILPMELILAIATGVTAGAAVLATLGVPDQRMGPEEIAESMQDAGEPVASVRAAPVESKGSRPFTAAGVDGRRLFIKVLGSDQRDADLSRSPVKLALVFGGSAAVTQAYLGSLAASVAALGGGASLAEVGAIYLGASIIAVSPTPGGLGGGCPGCWPDRRRHSPGPGCGDVAHLPAGDELAADRAWLALLPDAPKWGYV